MSLPTVFDKLDDVPEVIREHYKEREGKFYLEVDRPEVVATGLAKNRDDVLKEKKELATKLSSYESKFKGKSLEEIEALILAAEAVDTDKIKKEGNIDALLDKWKNERTDIETKHKGEIDSLTNQLNKFRIDAKLHKAALDGGVIKEIADDVVDLVRQRVQLSESGDLIVLDKPGGDPMSVSVEKFFSDVFKSERPHYYEASGAGGSGASNGTKPGKRVADYSKLSAGERLKLARQQTT